MKTQNTTNTGNFTKVVFTSIAAFIIGFSAVAQTSFNVVNLQKVFTEKAMAEKVVEESVFEPAVTTTIEFDVYTGSLDFVMEGPMEVENWMLTGADWLVEEVEEEIQIEDWMTSFSSSETVSSEDEIALEAWMYTMESWK